MREIFAETKRQPPGWSYGGYAQRRREGAILQQCALRTKLRKAHTTHLGRSHTKNAFASTDQGETTRKSIENLSVQSAPFTRQRNLEATTSMRAPAGFVTVTHGAGALQGDSVAGEIFSNTYEPQISAWVTETADARLMVTSPFTGARVDASLNGFADDLLRATILDRCRAPHAALTVSRNDTSLDHHLSKIDVAQHPGKLKVCGVLGGKAAGPFNGSCLGATSYRAPFLSPLSILFF
jgi:hypothetical protein